MAKVTSRSRLLCLSRTLSILITWPVGTLVKTLGNRSTEDGLKRRDMMPRMVARPTGGLKRHDRVERPQARLPGSQPVGRRRSECCAALVLWCSADLAS